MAKPNNTSVASKLARTAVATTATTGATAPATATVATPKAAVALPKGSGLCNGKAVAGAVATTAGNAYTVPANGGNGVVHFIALHAAPTTCAAPQTWPGAYSGTTNATTATVAGGPSGSNGAAYVQWGVHVPSSGTAAWAVVHCYPGKAGTVVAARANGNGTMVACQGGSGARMGGSPCKATLALAASYGLAAPKGAS